MTQKHRTTWSRPATFVLALWVAIIATQTAWAGSGRINEAIGEVERGRGTPPVFEAVKRGDEVAPGDVIRTGRGGRVELVLGAGTVRLYENSLLRVPGDAKAGHEVELERGRSIFDVLKAKVTDRFEVRTPEVVVSVKGTRFEVDLVGKLAEVAVFRGTVGVRAPDAALELETLVREGFAAMGKADTPFELDLRPRTDPWESWASSTEPQQTALETTRLDRKAELHIQAQAAARNSSAKELIGIATARNPQIAKRVAELRRERAEAQAAAAEMQGGAQEDPTAVAPGATSMPARIDPSATPEPDATPDAAVMEQMQTMMKHQGAGSGTQDDRAMKAMRAIEMGMDPNEIMARLEADRENSKQMDSSMNDPGTMTEMIELPEDPTGGAGGVGGGWDPTPDLEMMAVMQLGLPMSYTDTMQFWYFALDEIYMTDPTIFDNPDPSLYHTALLNKFNELGLPSAAAQNLVDYIMSQIQY